MLIAVTGEGSTDYGKRDYQTGTWQDGAVMPYMRKIAEEITEEPLEFYIIEKENVNGKRLQRRSMGTLNGRAIPAKKFAMCMQEEGIQKGVFYCDVDKESGTRNTDIASIRQFQKVYQEVTEGLCEVDAIPMVALRMLESWILGDVGAIESALDIRIPSNKVPSRPEFLWGAKNDPSSNYPKNYLRRIIRESHPCWRDFDGNREDYVEITNCADIATMCRKCPVSFQMFYEDFCGLLCNEES